jgi:hypothetical protein
MRPTRTKCLSTKVSDDEYATFVELAGEQNICAWMRAVLLQAAAPPVEPVLLAELLALRTILLNLHFSLCRGELVTVELMERFIERADQDKARQAHERLAAIERRSS